MSQNVLQTLFDQATEAHARIQEAYETINPVVEVRRGMRDNGIPADAMTIDCLRTRKRIMLILHDAEPGVLLYDFGKMDEDVSGDFRRMNLSDVGPDLLFDWMQDYFSGDAG